MSSSISPFLIIVSLRYMVLVPKCQGSHLKILKKNLWEPPHHLCLDTLGAGAWGEGETDTGTGRLLW